MTKRTQRENASDFNALPDDGRELPSSRARFKAAAAAGEAIWRAATSPAKGTAAVGFGGGHYCNKQCSALRRDGYAFSHILSKYFFEDYDEQIVRMAFERTLGGCRTAVVDWKGVRGSERSRLIETLKKMDVEVVRV